jgi:hypothetical protein
VSEEPKPGDDVFTEEDLAPTAADRRGQLKLVVDKVAASIAVTVLGGWAGGLVVLHWATIPWVLELTPPPLAGRVLAAILTTFNGMAIGCGAIALGCEVVRTAMTAKLQATAMPRIRRYLAIVLAVAMAYLGMVLTPQISSLVQTGITPKVGPDGIELARLTEQAELIGVTTIPLAAALIALHLFTLPRATEPEEDEEVLTPLPPGPGTQS